MKKKLIITKILQKQDLIIQSTVTYDTFSRANGIVKDSQGNKYFFKCANQKHPYAYRSLFNEAKVTEHLSDFLRKYPIIRSGYRLYVPPVRMVLKQDGYLFVLTKFISAASLSEANKKVQTQHLIQASELIKQLCHPDLALLKPYLMSYTKPAMVVQLVPRAIKALLLRPEQWYSICKLFFRSLGLLFVTSPRCGIVHADLNITNILYVKKTIYVTDWEEAGWGNPNYSLTTPLCFSLGNQKFMQLLAGKLSLREMQSIKLLSTYKILTLFNQQMKTDDSRFIRDKRIIKLYTDYS